MNDTEDEVALQAEVVSSHPPRLTVVLHDRI